MEQSIDIIVNQITSILKDSNPSIYLFGSVVLGDFKLGWSDIDILCLTNKPISENQAEHLVNLRQTLLKKYPGNPYYRLFEGGILSLAAFLNKTTEKVVYWGTSGQRITEDYVFEPFSLLELLDSGKLLFGTDIRDQMKYPSNEDLRNAVINHYNTIRKYAVNPGRTLYSVGWLLDIARCLYTLQTGKIIAKTKAGEWAIDNDLTPNMEVLQKAVEIRKNPLAYKNDEATQAWLETLGEAIQEFADVLEEQIK